VGKEEIMAEPTKHLKNVLTSYKPGSGLPAYRHKMDRKLVRGIVNLDADTVPGAEFYSEAMWIVPGDKSKEGMTQYGSHTHSWGEFVGFFGLNYENIKDLGAEIEFTIDNEKYLITDSFAAYIPPGVQHGPLTIRNVKRPIMHFMAGPTKRYV
jgi:hypothetical protein